MGQETSEDDLSLRYHQAALYRISQNEKDDLLTRGALPPSSSARDMHCVMCPVRRGSPRMLFML